MARFLDENNTTSSAESSTNQYDGDDLWAGYDEYYGYDLTSVDKATFVLVRIFGGLSLLSVICTASETWADHRAGKGTTVTRILLPYQFSLLLNSIAYVLGTWPSPSGAPDVWGASGTVQTCEAQGFILQLATQSGVPWDICLSVTYVLMVRYNWSHHRLRRMEPYFHMFIWPFGLAAAIIPLRLELYNNNWEVCWIDSVPWDCEGSYRLGGETDCIRGDNGWIYQLAFSGFPVIGMLVAIACMVSIYLYIRCVEKKNQRYYSGPGRLLQVNRHRRSRQAAVRGMLYSSTMVLTYAPLFVGMAIDKLTGVWRPNVTLITSPLATCNGLFVMLVFVQTRKRMRTRYGRAVRKVLCGVCCCSCALWDACRRARKNNRTRAAENEEMRVVMSQKASIMEELKASVGVNEDNFKEEEDCMDGVDDDNELDETGRTEITRESWLPSTRRSRRIHRHSTSSIGGLFSSCKVMMREAPVTMKEAPPVP